MCLSSVGLTRDEEFYFCVALRPSPLKNNDFRLGRDATRWDAKDIL